MTKSGSEAKLLDRPKFRKATVRLYTFAAPCHPVREQRRRSRCSVGWKETGCSNAGGPSDTSQTVSPFDRPTGLLDGAPENVSLQVEEPTRAPLKVHISLLHISAERYRLPILHNY